MEEKIIKSSNPFESIINELKLFTQQNYCKQYILTNFTSITDEIATANAEISSASFRQAMEFYNSALNTTISTSPLLYSYCLNNLIKGAIYLITDQKEIHELFNDHGFEVKREYLRDNILESEIRIKKSGPPTAIAKILCSHVIESQKITFRSLISHIPELYDIYYKTTKKSPDVARCTNVESLDYEIDCLNLEDDLEEKKSVYDFIGLMSTYSERDKKYYCCITERGKKTIRDNNLENDIFYNNDIILPLQLKEGIFCSNIMLYSYLTIMAYGMLVRYNPDKWENYIDPKLSNEYALIDLSINKCVTVFISQVHRLLFKYTYKVGEYSDIDVKKVINEQTEQIMNNIRKEIQHKRTVYGSRYNWL